MSRFAYVLAALLAGLLLAPSSFTQTYPDTDAPTGPASDVLVRFEGDLVVGAGDVVPPALVLDGDAVVDGVVRGVLVVVDGAATVSGVIDGSVVIVGGTLELAPTARVRDDVVLVESTVARSTGAVVGGEVTSTSAHEPGLNAFFWLSTTVAAVAGALLLAFLLGGRTGPIDAALTRPGASAAVGLALAFGLPLLAVALLASGIGFVLGLSVLLNVVPAFVVVGYLVSALALGELIRLRVGRPSNPYAAGALGALVLQVFLAVPLLGVLALLAAPYGAGALLVALWRLRGRRAAPSDAELPGVYATA